MLGSPLHQLLPTGTCLRVDPVGLASHHLVDRSVVQQHRSAVRADDDGIAVDQMVDGVSPATPADDTGIAKVDLAR
ncbi:hypothetical protein [Streptomyces sp. NPDC001492]